VTGTTLNSSGETGEPNHAGWSTPLNSVWYNYTAPTAGSVSLSLQGSGFDTTLAVYTGSAVNALTQVASNDDANGTTLQSALTFTPVPGPPYRIPIDGFSDTQGNFNLALINLNAAYPTAEDTPLTVAAPGVLANDSVVGGGTLSAVLVSGPAHGTLTLN